MIGLSLLWGAHSVLAGVKDSAETDSLQPLRFLRALETRKGHVNLTGLLMCSPATTYFTQGLFGVGFTIHQLHSEVPGSQWVMIA